MSTLLYFSSEPTTVNNTEGYVLSESSSEPGTLVSALDYDLSRIYTMIIKIYLYIVDPSGEEELLPWSSPLLSKSWSSLGTEYTTRHWETEVNYESVDIQEGSIIKIVVQLELTDEYTMATNSRAFLTSPISSGIYDLTFNFDIYGSSEYMSLMIPQTMRARFYYGGGTEAPVSGTEPVPLGSAETSTVSITMEGSEWLSGEQIDNFIRLSWVW